MALMQDTAEISKTNQEVYLVTMIRRSADLPMYLDNMVYDSPDAGHKFMAKLVAAFERAGYRKEKIDDDHYKLNNGLDKISLTGKIQSVFTD